MRIKKLNEWKCGIDIDDASVYVEPTGALKDMVEYFKLKYNPITDCYDCDGDVDLYDYYDGLGTTKQRVFNAAFVRNGKMTIKFGDVKGCFALPGNERKAYVITSLEGCPKSVCGDFDCGYNELTSLKYCPKSVGGSFSCAHNRLTTLKGSPKSVGDCFDCSHNQLTSLEGCPDEIEGYFDCSHNQLTSLKHSPITVKIYFDCSNNQLNSLDSRLKKVGSDFACHFNQLTSLEGCPEIVGGTFDCYDNKVVFAEKYVRSVCDVKKEIYV